MWGHVAVTSQHRRVTSDATTPRAIVGLEPRSAPRQATSGDAAPNGAQHALGLHRVLGRSRARLPMRPIAPPEVGGLCSVLARTVVVWQATIC
jgi:hypothetical protein